MAYIQGFIVPVPEGAKDEYVRFAHLALPLFKEFGATRQVEAWADDVPDGKVTDFRKAVQARDGETVVFSWLEYPDRQACEAAGERMRNDPRMQAMGEMPFDGQRMIYAGFEPMIEEGGGRRGGYMDGFVVPVPEAKRDAYREMAAKGAPIFQEHGALRIVEAWGEDVPEGKVTDYRRAVQAQDGEKVVFSFIEWPDKDTRNRGWEKVMSDPRMQPPEDTPFDGKRMFWGGFTPGVDG